MNKRQFLKIFGGGALGGAAVAIGLMKVMESDLPPMPGGREKTRIIECTGPKYLPSNDSDTGIYSASTDVLKLMAI